MWKEMLLKCLKYGLLGLLVLIIIVNLYLGLNKTFTHDPVPKFLGFSPLIVMSGSMKPALMPGDVVIIREQAPEKYKPGDVVTYLEGNIAYTHRIVREENNLFVLKGDNNNVEDDSLPAEQFIGKVFINIPKIGLAILFFKTPTGMMVLLFLLVMCIYGEDFYRWIRKKSCIRRNYSG